jgi:peroxiredoxin
MKTMNTLRIGTVLAAALILIPAAFAASGEIAPDFTLENLRGDRITLSDALADGPVILDFWATWCGPCRKALPALQELATEFGDDVTVLTVSIDDPRSRSKIGSTMRSLGLKMPVLLDSDKSIASLYRVVSVPSTFLIASDGTIAKVHSGYRDGDMRLLASELGRLLSEGQAK